MKFRNTDTDYGLFAIGVHWCIALLFIGLFALGLYMTGLTYYDPWYREGPDLHRSLGIIVFGLLILRLVWRGVNVSPKVAKDLKAWEIRSAHLMHIALYFLLLAIVISGYLISTADGRSIQIFNWFQVPALIPSVEHMEDYAGTIHYTLSFITMSLVILHVLAALKHHFINKDRTLSRMLGTKY